MDTTVVGFPLSRSREPTSVIVDSNPVVERSCVRILQTNIRSVMNKRDELEELAARESPSLIALTETWLNADVMDSEIAVPGYSIFRCDRSTRNGGGVMLLVREEYTSYLLHSSSDIDGYYEGVWCKVKLSQNGYVTVGVIYRSPGSHPLMLLSDIQNFCKGNHYLLLGDFNAPGIDWSSGLSTHLDPFSRELLATVTDLYLYQHVNMPTRVTPLCASTLYLVFSPHESDVHNLKILPPLG